MKKLTDCVDITKAVDWDIKNQLAHEVLVFMIISVPYTVIVMYYVR